MAQRRMISKSISTSTKLSEVDTFSKLLFTWLIPHCDDYGHMDGSSRLVKGIVVPLCNETIEEVESSLKQLEEYDLIKRYEKNGKLYLEIVKWVDHQTLKTDRPLHVIYPLPDWWKPDNSKWKPVYSKRKNKLSEVKLSEVNIREDKSTPINKTIEYLNKLPESDIKEFTSRFVATDKEIKSKAESLKLYCESKGRRYLNYRSFLLNALKRDFKERGEKQGKYSKLS